MTLFSHFTQARSRFGPALRGSAATCAERAAYQPRSRIGATLTRAELQREIIALIG